MRISFKEKENGPEYVREALDPNPDHLTNESNLNNEQPKLRAVSNQNQNHNRFFFSKFA